MGCCLFVCAQTIGVAHAADLKLHSGGVSCHICAATGQLAAPPIVATAPDETIEFVHRIPVLNAVESPARPIFSPHSARAPPTFL
jgi:hypothetical protein